MCFLSAATASPFITLSSQVELGRERARTKSLWKYLTRAVVYIPSPLSLSLFSDQIKSFHSSSSCSSSPASHENFMQIERKCSSRAKILRWSLHPSHSHCLPTRYVRQFMLLLERQPALNEYTLAMLYKHAGNEPFVPLNPPSQIFFFSFTLDFTLVLPLNFHLPETNAQG